MVTSPQVELLAPLSGVLMALDNVPDPVFASRLIGDGLCIDPTSQVLCAPLAGVVDHWCLADLPSPRSAPATQLAGKLGGTLDTPEKSVLCFADPGAAFANAMSRAGENDRIVVFGSFYTVAGVMAARKTSHH